MVAVSLGAGGKVMFSDPSPEPGAFDLAPQTALILTKYNPLELTEVRPAAAPGAVPPGKRPAAARSKLERSQKRVNQLSGGGGFEAHEDDIHRCESTYGKNLQNPGSSASGHYGIIDSTWAGYGGYKSAKDAPQSVQRERARQIYERDGIGAWNASASCRNSR